jgi:hypothetical protein
MRDINTEAVAFSQAIVPFLIGLALDVGKTPADKKANILALYETGAITADDAHAAIVACRLEAA